MTPVTWRWTVFWTVSIIGGAIALVVVGVVGFRALMSSTLVQDRVYDNVPSAVDCADVPDWNTVEQAARDFPEIGDAEAGPVERCDGAIIEVQYAGHSTREDVEEYLREHGRWEEETGWWWKSIPVELRNV